MEEQGWKSAVNSKNEQLHIFSMWISQESQLLPNVDPVGPSPLRICREAECNEEGKDILKREVRKHLDIPIIQETFQIKMVVFHKGETESMFHSNI